LSEDTDSDPDPRTEPPRGLESKRAPASPRSRYSLYVGLAFVALAIGALINTVQTDEGGIAGIGDETGSPLAEFAIPDLLGPLEGDANIFQDDCETSRNPCPTDDVRTPACEVSDEDAIRVCDFFDRPLAISFWFTSGGDCIPTQDAFNEVAEQYEGRANFLSVDVRDDREEAQRLVESLDWSVPVGHDRDGAVSNIYQIGVCPTLILARPGGILDSEEIKSGNFSAEEIAELIDGLIERSVDA